MIIKRLVFVLVLLLTAVTLTAPGQVLANSPDDTPTPEQRLRAAGIEPSLDVLRDVLANQGAERELRYWAALALGRSGQDAALSTLLEAWPTAEGTLRFGIVAGLGELGNRGAVSALGTALDDADPGVRLVAVQALGRIGGPRAAAALAAKLDDPVEERSEIRMNAALQLGRLREPGAVAALGTAVRDRDPAVRAAAAIGLARFQKMAAAEYLVDAIFDPDIEEWQRVDAVRTLEEVSGERFEYLGRYHAPQNPTKRAAALERIANWWESRDRS